MTQQHNYSARKFLAKTTEYLRERVQGTFNVLFEDGVTVTMTAQQLLYNSRFWDIHRELPWLPLVSDHCVTKVLKGRPLNASTHRVLFESIFWFVHDKAKELNQSFTIERVDALNEMIYRKTNELYNYACLELEEFIISTDIDDYEQVLEHPPIKEVLENLRDNENSIREAYEKVQSIISTDTALSDNELVISVRNGLVKMSQMLQCIVCRGYVTDIDSKIFPEPSMGCFIRGFDNYYSLLIDTRTAAKSLHFSALLLRQTEYNSRKLQILCQSVQNLHHGDCGSQHYLSFKISDAVHNDDGSLKRKGDLHRWAGKYYLDEESNQLKELKPTDTHLVGKVLKFRSSLAGCAHPDPHGVCSTCFGAMAIIIPEHTNIGYMLTAALMQILSQSILSVKHEDASSKSNKAVLNHHQAKFLEVDSTGMNYLFNRKLQGMQVRLHVAESEIPGIASLQSTEYFETVSPSHFSELSQTIIVVEKPGNADIDQMPLDLSSEKRFAFFTRDALLYIKKQGWTREGRNVIIDFTDWDNSKPFASLPQRHFNNADHAKDIADLIQGRNDSEGKNQKSKQVGTSIDYFMDLYELVVSRLQDVPAVIIEHIIYGASIRNSAIDDYRLPKAGQGHEMGVLSKTVPRRSMGSGMSFEDHVRQLFADTTGFDPALTSSHPMDVFVTPQEAVADAAARGLR